MPVCCATAARWVGWRRRAVLTRAGVVRIRRPYWHCAACGQGHFSDTLGDRVGASQATWGVKAGVAGLGTQLPFAVAARVWTGLTGLPVSARTVETWVEEVGQAYAPATPGPHDPGPAAAVVYVQVDAAMVRFTDGWHEQKAAVAWGQEGPTEGPLHHWVGQGSWATHEAALTALARRAGSRRAHQMVCIADGAPPIWTTLTRLWPHAVQILDWYHVQEHLADVARDLPDGPAWHAAQREALATVGPGPVLRGLTALARHGETTALRTAARQCFGYLFRHRARLDYPRYRALGYPLGSGRIEAACKQVILGRAKGCGMRWEPSHVQAVLTARCAFLDDRWEYAVGQARARAA